MEAVLGFWSRWSNEKEKYEESQKMTIEAKVENFSCTAVTPSKRIQPKHQNYCFLILQITMRISELSDVKETQTPRDRVEREAAAKARIRRKKEG